MVEGYCTLEDVRRALREKDLPGDVSQDNDIAVDAIVSQTRWLEKTYKRHFYAETGDNILKEASTITIPQSPKTRDDEHDIQTHGGLVHGASERDRRARANSDALLEAGPRHDRRRRDRREPKREIRIATGGPNALEPPVDEDIPAYTRIRLERKDVDALNELHVVNEDGGYDDWVADSNYTGGVGTTNRGNDYWARVNSGGVSELYLDVHSLDDDIASLSNAVYMDYDFGRSGIPRTVRRAVAFRAAADLVEEAVIEIPQQATLYDIETKADELRSQAEELLGVEGG